LNLEYDKLLSNFAFKINLCRYMERVTTYDGAVRYKHLQFVKSDHAEDSLKLIAMSDATG